MDFAGKTKSSRYYKSDTSIYLLTIGLQLALYGYIIIIRLLQTTVGSEISS